MYEAVPLIRLDNVTKFYGENAVLSDISLNFKSGRNVLIQGPSGCGKTTLLRCMALLETIQGGRIEFLGDLVLAANKKPAVSRSVRLSIAMVFQELHLWPHMTVLDNVALPLRRVTGISKNAAVEEARRMLGILGIDEKRSQFPATLSGGQQQRTALARALVHSPRMLLLDEITANLDETTAAQVLGEVEHISVLGTTVVMVSHARFVPPALKQSLLHYTSTGWMFEEVSGVGSEVYIK